MLSLISSTCESAWQVHDIATKNEAPLQTHLDLGIPDVLAPKINLLLGPVGLQLLHEFLAKVLADPDKAIKSLDEAEKF